ncbi:MAG TPA: hypothetical protein VGP25_11290 [Gemmatimonadaceae bacterium]|nr:hypothetical protein [Gemmatimonadaceae bacterium]
MPAFPPLPDAAPRAHADAAAHADQLLKAGRRADAIAYLSGMIEELERETEPVPAWPYGRLALLHRHARNYDDEVRVLERYQALVPDGTQRTRFAARLSKARALADRQFSGTSTLRMRA